MARTDAAKQPDNRCSRCMGFTWTRGTLSGHCGLRMLTVPANARACKHYVVKEEK